MIKIDKQIIEAIYVLAITILFDNGLPDLRVNIHGLIYTYMWQVHIKVVNMFVQLALKKSVQ